MYKFQKKFKRPKTFFYRNEDSQRNVQSKDLDNAQQFSRIHQVTDNPNVSHLSYEQKSVACNVNLNEDSDHGEECLADNDLLNQSENLSEDSDHEEECLADDDLLNQSENYVSPVYHYAWLLMQFGYVTNVFEHQSFAVLDYNTDKRTIMHTSYVFVHRYPHRLCDRYGWVSCCSCDQSRMQFVQALDEQIDSELDEVIPYPSCLHISAMEVFLDIYDKKSGIDVEEFFIQSKKSISCTGTAVFSEHSYYQMQPQEEVFSAVCGGSQWIAVKPVNHHWGVCTFVYTKVTPPQPEIKCSTCSSYHCVHVTTLARAMEETSEDDESPLAIFKISTQISPQMRDYFEMATRSEEKVQLFVTSNENDANDFAGLPENSGLKFFVPSVSGCCPCGAEWDRRVVENEWLDVENCSVAYLYAIHNLNVYFRRCSLCTNKKRYDGFENNVVWFGSYCISHAVLKDYIRLFITSSLPMYKYYVAYVQRQVAAGNFTFPQKITYTKFRLAVIAMIRLLDVNFEDGFFCKTCGKIPNKIVMDGTTLGIQKTYLPNSMVQSDTGLLDGSRFEMRNFINRKSVRELLKKYCKSLTSLEEFQELIAEMPSPGLKVLLQSLEQQGFTSTCPEPCRRLLIALASDKPVCAIVPPNEKVWDLLKRISDGVNPKNNPSTDLKLLQEQVPLLFHILSTCHEIPADIRLLVGELVLKSASPFMDENNHQRSPHNLPTAVSNASGSNGYLPCLPELVQRGNYVLDNKRTKEGDCAKVARPKKKHGTLIPGIFCILCPHGICYGFQIMRDHESPNVPYSILRTRFSEAPELVIYDNSCKLHEYCLNRDPAFFKNTKFVVDKFHWKNHSGCSEGYNIKLYPTLTVYNSQVAEQCNSSIKPLASMVSYMEYDNFLLFSKLYIWYRNMLRIVKCNPDRDIPYKDYFHAISNVLH